MVVDTKEKLEEALSKVGIVGEWIDPDEYEYNDRYRYGMAEKYYKAESEE